MVASNSLFLSYRRSNGFAWARLVWDDLSGHGIDAFLDLESIRDAGQFDAKILNQIEARPFFVPVLVKGSLERCVDPDDWFRREIEHAVATDRAIIPLLVDGFDFAESSRCLPPSAHRALRTSNGVPLVADFFAEAMNRLREDRLRPVERPTRTLTDGDREFAAEARQRAVQATVELPVVPPDAGEPPDEGDDVPVPTTSTAPTPPSTPTPPTPPTPSAPPTPRAWIKAHSRLIAVAGSVILLVLVGLIGAQLLGGADRSTSPTSDPASATSEDAADDGPTTPAPSAATTADHVDDEPGSIRRTVRGPSEHLGADRTLVSETGGHELGMTERGELVVTTNGIEWPEQPAQDSLGQLVAGGDYWTIQKDANLVLYAEPGEPLWSSESNGGGNTDLGDLVALVLEHDPETEEGLLEIRVNNSAIWTCRPDDCNDDQPTSTPAGTAEPTQTTETAAPSTDEPVTVPDVHGLPLRDAEAILRDVGLRPISDSPSGVRPGEVVIDQSVAPGTKVAADSSVELETASELGQGEGEATIE